MKFMKRLIIALVIAVSIVILLTRLFTGYDFFEMTFIVFSLVSLAMLFERILDREVVD